MSKEQARTLSPGGEQPGSRQAGPADGRLKSDDGYLLFYRYYEGRQKAPVVLYLHGIEGHSQWFARTAAYLNQLGMSVYAPDRRGAGNNRSERGHLSSYRQLIDDLRQLLTQVRASKPDCPLFLIGNCWGAKTAVAAVQDESVAHEVTGLVLTCPAIAAKVDFPLVTKLAIAGCWLVGSRHRFVLPIAPEQFTDNPQYIDFIRTDPDRLTEVDASLLIENVKLSRIARRGASRLTLPVLVMQAGCDNIVDTESVRNWFARIRSPDKELHVFPEAAHSLDFDAYPEEYMKCLSDWIMSRAGRAETCK